MVKTSVPVLRLLLLVGAFLLVSLAVTAEGAMEKEWARKDFGDSCAACHGSTL